ncbi:MAG: hypothetical protein ACPGQS_13465, partial [Bradymonadia bacterium]
VPNGLTFGVGDGRSPIELSNLYHSVFHDVADKASLHDRQQEAFLRYEALRLMHKLDTAQEYLEVHRSPLKKVGAGDPLIEALLDRTEGSNEPRFDR